MKRRALLFALVLVWMAIWVPPAYAAFRLERVDGSSAPKGLNIPRTLVLADVHWSVVDAPPRPRVVNRAPAASDLPPAYVIGCESGGSYTAKNPTSTASGKYQIIDSTWDNYRGYPTARSAPPAVQDAKASELWAGGAGKGHWRECL